ncbi:MAG: hypothetical protein ABSH30_03755 [Acidimicrobiales bacterium]|jgi:hypothetical protein
MMDKSPREHWKTEPDDHDFPAAVDYLSLLVDPDTARSTAGALRHATGTTKKAKDLLRASGLALLPPDNAHVASDLAKVDQGNRLSPVLLVRGRLQRGVPLTIADGYHRICASYHLDENADIPCRIVDIT